MELTLATREIRRDLLDSDLTTCKYQDLTQVGINLPYIIKGIDTHEQGMKDFLFTLGCFEGEKITVISILAENYIIHLKDARYSIDADLARAILV